MNWRSEKSASGATARHGFDSPSYAPSRYARTLRSAFTTPWRSPREEQLTPPVSSARTHTRRPSTNAQTYTPPQQSKRNWPRIAAVLAFGCIVLAVILVVVLVVKPGQKKADAGVLAAPPSLQSDAASSSSASVSSESTPSSTSSRHRHGFGPPVSSSSSSSTTSASTSSSASKSADAPPPASTDSLVPAGTPSDGIAHESIMAHNLARSQYGSPPLSWNELLAKDAQTYIEGCNFEHSGGPYGENLYGAGPKVNITTGVLDSWVGEVKDYDYNDPPGNGPGETGHFSAVVWHDSTQLGCGLAPDCPGMQLYICRYLPTGNVGGGEGGNEYYRKNVLPKGTPVS